jgi:phosphohistidine swiveling domain-containing protein
MGTIIDLCKSRRLRDFGEKAKNLHWLYKNGCRIPQTFVLPSSFYRQYLKEPQTALHEITSLLEKTLNPESCYAVRSSANLEDTLQHSFAGQFRTYLDIAGLENLVQAVQGTWDSAHSASLATYAEKSGKSLEEIELAVLIQEMVSPVISGVAFSKNPLTGLNETVIEAVCGRGDLLVQDGIAPDRWVFRWGDWITRPESSAIDPELVRQVALETPSIAKKYRTPVDLEWVYNGQDLYWLQLRPISNLDQIPLYSNRISREVFPGLIKPLIWSVNVPLVNTVWINLISELTGEKSLKPDDLAKSFGYRSYFNMGTLGQIFELAGFPRESLEILLGLPGGAEKPRFKPGKRTFLLLPRVLLFILRQIRVGPEVLRSMEKAGKEYRTIQLTPIDELDPAGLLERVDRLYAAVQRTAHYNVVVPLLMNVYNLILRTQLTRRGISYSEFDLTAGLAELEQYDPNRFIQLAAEELNRLPVTEREQLAAASYSEFMQLPGFQGVQQCVAEIINCFGHLSESGNDFSAVPWRETPDLVLQMVVREAERLRDHSEGSSVKIKTHFETGVEKTSQGDGTYRWETLPLSPIHRRLLGPIYRRARFFRLYREVVSSTYTYGYGLFRDSFLALGDRFCEQSMLHHREDIFYLRWEEVRAAVVGTANPGKLMESAAQRKLELENSRDLQLPDVIYGDEIPPMLDPKETDLQSYSGIPASRGYYRGPVKVICSLADSTRLNPGDVLVIPFSDVSWTPLFTRAGAVIAESGGILSHSSIVAREFNLPCVVSVSGACQIPDGTLVSVDGYKGEILVHWS